MNDNLAVVPCTHLVAYNNILCNKDFTCTRRKRPCRGGTTGTMGACIATTGVPIAQRPGAGRDGCAVINGFGATTRQLLLQMQSGPLIIIVLLGRSRTPRPNTVGREVPRGSSITIIPISGNNNIETGIYGNNVLQ